MLKNIKYQISRNLTNLKGWQSSKKLIIIESDDWGSLRMPSIKAFNDLVSKGINVNKSPYCKFDSLESIDDIEALLEVLIKFKNNFGQHPIFTLNTVLANPDFQRIKDSDYNEYFYEPFTTTYIRTYNSLTPLALLKEGISNKLIIPQFHGREHINVSMWLNKLRSNNYAFIEAFKHNMWGLSSDVITENTKSIQSTFDYSTPEEIDFLKISIREGLDLFENIFGFRSLSFMPNNFIFPTSLENELIKNNIQVLQGMKYQISPLNISGSREYSKRYTGKTTSTGLLNLVRNCSFEPSINPVNPDSEIKRCISDIRNAFFWNRPAIISMHRLNFIGSLSEKNRSTNLNSLSKLLSSILEFWPDVIFMSSNELGMSILSERKYNEY